jgi:hypothetical protein
MKLRRLIFWDFARGSRAYDIVVLLILAFIFFTPKTWYKDQPRPHQVVEMPAEGGARVLYIEADLINADAPESQQITQAETVLSHSTGKPGKLLRLKPVVDDENVIKAWLAYVKP